MAREMDLYLALNLDILEVGLEGMYGSATV